jgi:hypothetical protein
MHYSLPQTPLLAAPPPVQELATAKAAAESKESKLGEAERQLAVVRKELADTNFLVADAEANAEEARKFKETVSAGGLPGRSRRLVGRSGHV